MKAKGWTFRVDKNFFRIDDVHYCYICRSTKLEIVNKHEYMTPEQFEKGAPSRMFCSIEGADSYHNTYYCPSCQRYIEYVTQLSIEDIDLAIEYVKEQFAMQGKQIRIDRFFEIKDGSLQKAVEDIKNIKGVKFEVYKDDNLVCELLYPKFIYLDDYSHIEKEQRFLIDKKKLFEDIKKRIKRID